MKGLLQSKIFKKNLGKWLFMYVMCMGLFTTVVTYSKYISNMLDQGDAARVSKFNINLQYCKDATCEDAGIEELDVEQYSPTGEIAYYFAVDSSNLEVNADLFFTLSTDHHFKIKKIEKIVGDKYELMSNNSKNENEKTATIADQVIAGSKEKNKYKVTVAYDETVIDYNQAGEVENGVVKDATTGLPKYIFNKNKTYDVLTIGYSATQTR